MKDFFFFQLVGFPCPACAFSSTNITLLICVRRPSCWSGIASGNCDSSHVEVAQGATLGCRRWKSIAASCCKNGWNTQPAKGVSHIRHLFTPLSTIPKKGLRTDEVSLLRHLTKQGCCKESRTSFLLVGGDNVAESLAAVTKSQLRRHGLQKVVNDPIEHRNVLAVHYVSKKPGLESVLNALARFKELAMKSCRQPALVFKEAPWDA